MLTITRNENTLIQKLIIVGDIILINIIALLTATFIPDLSDKVSTDFKIYILICNISILIAEFCIPPIIHLRNVVFSKIAYRMTKLVLIQAILSYTLYRIIFLSGGMFNALLFHIVISFVVIFASRILERKLLVWYRQRGGNIRTFILVGNDPANVMIYNYLANDPALGYKPLGYFSDSTINDCPKDLKKLGSLKELQEITSGKCEKKLYSNEIFCSVSHDEVELISSIMRYCDKNVIHFYYVPRILGSLKLGLSSERVGDFTLFTNHIAPLDNPNYKFAKRCFDIIISLFVCIFLLPIIPIVAIIIKLQSPGPIFFAQERTGFNGKKFKCLKFRSMHVNNDADKAQATENDPRKFPFGSFMRKTNLDEFPQFFNVLRGDMSIVGPRPHMLYHTELYSNIIDKYMVRHFSKPGITGYAQVTGYRGETKELWQMEERIKRDIWYIENWSIWLDIQIIFKTAKSIIIKDENAY